MALGARALPTSSQFGGFSFSVTECSGCKDAKCLPPNPLINIWQFESERNDADKIATQLQILLLVLLFPHFPLIGQQQRRRSRHSPSPSNSRSRRQSPFVASAESKPMQTRTMDRRRRRVGGGNSGGFTGIRDPFASSAAHSKSNIRCPTRKRAVCSVTSVCKM